MRRISAGALALCLAIAWHPARCQGTADDAVERAGGRPDPSPAAGKKPTSEAEAASTAVKQKIHALDEASKARDPKDKTAAAHRQEMMDILTRRRDILIPAWEAAIKDRVAAERPEQTPEAEAAELKAAAERDRALLARAAKEPASLLPEVFRAPTLTDAALAEMNVAIDRAKGTFDDCRKAVEVLTVVPGQKATSPLAEARADRDEIHKRMATIAPRQAEAETAASVAVNAEARELAREKLENLDWERKIEVENLRKVEIRIDLAARRANLSELQLAEKKVKLEFARVTLEALQARYKEIASRQVAALKKESETAGARAARSTDPLDRYQAQRTKELLDQKALYEERYNELLATPAVSLEDQREKAEDAASHFKELKKVVSDGRSADIVAQRLNNNYRRLASERAALVRNELARVVAQLDGFERELTEIESVELNDLQGDRAFRENLLSSLAPKRQKRAIAMFDAFEKEKHEILLKRKKVLVDLSKRADETQKEILKRIATMDETHAFIRTHLFWVRDQPALGLAAIDQGRRDARDAARTILGMAAEAWDPSRRVAILPEFLLGVAGLVALPWLLHRLRKFLRQRLRMAGAGAGRVELAS